MLHQEPCDEIFGNIRLYANLNTKVVEVLEKPLSFTSENEIDRILRTMEKRITKPLPNLLQIYSIEYMQEE